MNQIRLILSQFKELYLRMTGAQRLSVGLFAGSLLVLLGIFINHATSPTQPKTLFWSVSPNKAAAITQKLESIEVKATYRNGMIIVPASEDLDRLRMALAQDDLLPDDLSFDFSKIVKETGFVLVKDERDRNYDIALGNEIAKIIMSMDSIIDANVLLGKAEDNPLLKRSMPRTASVNVSVRNKRRLTADEVKAIANLTASAVRELVPQKVAISDSLGRHYEFDPEGSAADKWKMKHEEEKKYQLKIEEHLLAFIPKVKATVEVDLDLRKEEYELQDLSHKDLVGGGSSAPTRSLVEKEQSKSKEGSQGVVGTDVNTQANIKEGDGGTQMDMSKSKKQDEFLNSLVKKKIIHDKGDMVVKSVAVAIVNQMLNPKFNPMLPPSEENLEYIEHDWFKNPTDKQNLTQQIANIVGLADINKVSLTQQPMMLARTPVPPGFMDRAADWLNLHSVLLLMLALAIAGTLILVKMIRKAQPEEDILPMPEYDDESDKDDLPPLVEPEIDPKVRQIENRVKEIIDDEPQKAAGLIRHWLTSD